MSILFFDKEFFYSWFRPYVTLIYLFKVKQYVELSTEKKLEEQDGWGRRLHLQGIHSYHLIIIGTQETKKLSKQYIPPPNMI